MTSTNDSIQHIDGWNGAMNTFHEEVAEAIENAIDDAATHRRTAPLYRAWSALVQKRKYLKDGHVLLTWNLLEDRKEKLAELEGWTEHVEPVLKGTLAAIWHKMPQVLGFHPPEEQIWCKAVFAAMKSVVGSDGERDPDEFEACDALVELVARVYSVRSPGGRAGWRRVASNRARALAMRAKCRISDPMPMSVAALVSHDGDTRAEDRLDAARIVLCFRAHALSGPVPEGADPIEELARRIAEPFPGESEHLPVDTFKIEELLRHLAFEKKSPVAGLLERCVGYKPYVRLTERRLIEFVDSLDLNVMLIGQTKVGKSSFLFASEHLLSGGHEDQEPDPKQGTYPQVDLRHVAGFKLDENRRKWEDGEPSRDTDYNISATTKPFGLYSFNIMDSPGEIVGAGAHEGGNFFPHLPYQIKRLRPRVLVLMLAHGGNKENAADFENGVARGIHNIRVMLKEEEGKTGRTLKRCIEAFPVYVIENKADILVASRKPEETGGQRPAAQKAENQYRKALAKEIGQRAFDLGPYFEKAGDIDGALRNLRNDGDVADGGVAVRDLVIETCKERKRLLDQLRIAGFRNVHLVFTSSLPDEKSREHVGVKAFWSHLWNDTSGLFSKALRSFARRLLVEELKEAARKIESRGDDPNGIMLPRAPGINEAALREAYYGLIGEAKGVTHFIRWKYDKFNQQNSLRDNMNIMSIHWREAMASVDKFEQVVDEFLESWNEILRRLIVELNVPPSISCNKLIPEPLRKEEVDLLRDARRQIALAMKKASAAADSSSAEAKSAQGHSEDAAKAAGRSEAGAGAAETATPRSDKPEPGSMTIGDVVMKAEGLLSETTEAGGTGSLSDRIDKQKKGEPAGETPLDDMGLLEGGRFSVVDVVRLALAMRGVDRERIDQLMESKESKPTNGEDGAPAVLTDGRVEHCDIALGPLLKAALGAGGADEDRISEVIAGIEAVLQSRQDLKHAKRLTTSDVHGFWGSLRHTALIREKFEIVTPQKDVADAAFAWLKKGGRKSLFEHVESDLGRTTDKQQRILENALWLVSDWGVDAGVNEVGNAPDYRSLVVRRYERDRFLLYSHVSVSTAGTGRSPADRIEFALALVRSVGEIRNRIESGRGVCAEFRTAVEGLLLSVVLRALQFDVEMLADVALEEESTPEKEGLLTSVKNALAELKNQKGRHYLPIVGREKYHQELENQERALSRVRIQAGGRIFSTAGGPSACRAAHNVAVFAEQAVAAAGPSGGRGLVLIGDGTDEKDALNTAMQRPGKILDDLKTAVTEYHEQVERYLATTLRTFLDMRYRYVLGTGLLQPGDNKSRMDLEEIVERPFVNMRAGFTDDGDSGKEAKKNITREVKAIKDFADVVDELIEIHDDDKAAISPPTRNS